MTIPRISTLKAGVVLFAVVAAAVPFMPSFWITLLNYIGIAVIVALGLVLLTGIGGLTSFGQAAFVGLGAYITAYLTTRHGISPWLTLPIGLGLTAVVAWTLGAITLRLSGHYLALATIAWGISLYYLFGNLAFLGKFDGISGIPPLEFAGLSLGGNKSMLCVIWLAVILAMLAARNLLDSRPGRAIRALKGGAGMGESFGIDAAKYKTAVFMIAALLACLAGWLYAHLQRAINPSPFSINAGIEYLFMAVVGGAAHVAGALAGATIVIIAKDVLQDILPRLLGTQANYEAIVFGVLLVLLLQRAHEGLWPLLRNLIPVEDRQTKAATPVAGDQLPSLSRRVPPPKNRQVLELTSVSKTFGGLIAVDGISFSVSAGEIMGLIGPNGAGKSTLFNLVTGVTPATSGEVRFLGERIDGLPARAIAARGLARTFQHVQLLPTMTVLENVALGGHLRASVGVVRAAVRADRMEETRMLCDAYFQLERVGLASSAHRPAGELSLGQQRILEIARALAADPILLMLDEPAAGLRYKEKEALASLLRGLREEGLSVLLVEHDMDFVMGIVDKLLVMNFGQRIAGGIPDEVRREPSVVEAYLGGTEDSLDLQVEGRP